MKKDKIKVYIYTRVSTTIQVDGYSLDAQKSRMKAFAEYNDYEIVGEYEDAGKSGKSIEGRLEFNRMMEDIKSGKDGVFYVLVFKLSRFGRNAADVLSTLQVMQDFGVNLICVEDGIDSSKDAGLPRSSVRTSVFRRWRAESRKPVRVNGTAALLPTDIPLKKASCSSMRKKPKQSASSLTSMCIPTWAQTVLPDTLPIMASVKSKDRTARIPCLMRLLG